MLDLTLDVDPKVLERIATIFVDKHIKDGPEASGAYALRHIPKAMYPTLRPIIQAKFKARNWRVSTSDPGPEA